MSFIKKLWILTPDGITLLYRNYSSDNSTSSKEKLEHEEDLIAGFLAALNSFSAEMTKSEIQGITLAEFEFHYVREDKEGVTAIAAAEFGCPRELIIEGLRYILSRVMAIRTKHSGFMVDTSFFQAIEYEADSYLILKGLVPHKVEFAHQEKEMIFDNLSPVRDLTFANDFKVLVSGGEDSLIKAWDWESKKLKYFIQGHNAPITDIIAIDLPTSSEHLLLSASEDESIRFWDADTGQPRGKFAINKSSISEMTISDEGNWLAIGTVNKNILLYKLELREPIHLNLLGEVNLPDIPIEMYSIYEESAVLYLLKSGEIGYITIEGFDRKVLFQANTKCLAMAPSKGTKEWAAISLNEGTIEIVDLSHWEQLLVIPFQEEFVKLEVLDDNETLLIACKNGQICIIKDIWRRETLYYPTIIVPAHTSNSSKARIAKIFYDKQKTYLVSGCIDSDIRVWNNLAFKQLKGSLQGIIQKIERQETSMIKVRKWIKENKEFNDVEEVEVAKRLLTNLRYFANQLERINRDEDFYYPWWGRTTFDDSLMKLQKTKSELQSQITEFEKRIYSKFGDKLKEKEVEKKERLLDMFTSERRF